MTTLAPKTIRSDLDLECVAVLKLTKLTEYGTSPLNEREETITNKSAEEDRTFKHLKNTKQKENNYPKKINENIY
jgi:hypothetical protein